MSTKTIPEISPKPQDLVELARELVENPSIGKRVRRSRLLSGLRRNVHKPHVALANTVAKGIGIGITKIPVPVVNSLLGLAWKAAVGKLKSKSHNSKLAEWPSEKDKIKFELKELGGRVAAWDRYRWKIAHGIDEVNKQVDKCKQMQDAPCDLWVKLIAKRMYLMKRIAKLRVSVEAVRAICEATLTWLENVEKDVKKSEQSTQALYEKDVKQLKVFAGAHAGCSDHLCMHTARTPSMRRSVPVRDWTKFLVKGAGELTNIGSDVDPVTTTYKLASK